TRTVYSGWQADSIWQATKGIVEGIEAQEWRLTSCASKFKFSLPLSDFLSVIASTDVAACDYTWAVGQTPDLRPRHLKTGPLFRLSLEAAFIQPATAAATGYLQLARSASDPDVRDRFITIARHYRSLAEIEQRIADQRPNKNGGN